MDDLHDSSRPNPQARQARLKPIRLVDAFRFAWQGLALAWRAQPNFRIEIVIGVAATALALWLGSGLVPVLICGMVVLSLELINSALEAAVDLASPGFDPLAKRAKDYAAASVLVASIGAAAVGLVVLGPPLVAKVLTWI